MTERSIEEILDFLNDKEELDNQEKLAAGWITALKNKINEKYDGQAHWGTLGKFLKDCKIIMLDNDGEKYNFSEDIIFYEQSCVKAKKLPTKKYWFENNFKAFERLVKNGEIGERTTDHNKHVYTIIWSMLDENYSFTEENSERNTGHLADSSNINHTISNNICSDLRKIAINLLKGSGNKPDKYEIYSEYHRMTGQEINPEMQKKIEEECKD